jgi:uncharacterized protein YuzE
MEHEFDGNILIYGNMNGIMGINIMGYDGNIMEWISNHILCYLGV